MSNDKIWCSNALKNIKTTADFEKKLKEYLQTMQI